MTFFSRSSRIRALIAGVVVGALIMAGVAVTGGDRAWAAPVAGRGGYTSAKLRADLATAYRSSGSVGLLAEVDGDGSTVEANEGTAVAGQRIPVPWNARFRIGSATKAFTATVVLQLVGEHRLSLDDTVDHWLPGVVQGNGYDGTRITVRELLQHTSGIFDYVDDQELTSALGSAAGFDEHRLDVLRTDDMVRLALSHQPTFTPPGSGWSYSNTDYLLLGMIIQQVTGESWARQVQDRILTPLGLHDTSVATGQFIRGPHPQGYERFPDVAGPYDVTRQTITGGKPDGSMISTTYDLATFFRALLGGRLLRPAQLAEMEQVVPAVPPSRDDAGYDYGLGLMRTPLPCGGYYWHHDGDVPGFHTRIGTTADGERSVVVELTTDPHSEHDVDTLIDHALCAEQGSH